MAKPKLDPPPARPTKAAARPRAAQAPAPAFDVAGLRAALAAPQPTRDDAALMFANEVSDRLYPAVAAQVAQFDPAWIVVIAQLVTAVVQNCAKADVQKTLRDCQHQPNGIPARMARLKLAAMIRWTRKRPGPELGLAAHFQLAKAILEAGVANVNGQLWNLMWDGQPDLPSSNQLVAPAATAAAAPGADPARGS